MNAEALARVLGQDAGELAAIAGDSEFDGLGIYGDSAGDDWDATRSADGPGLIDDEEVEVQPWRPVSPGGGGFDYDDRYYD